MSSITTFCHPKLQNIHQRELQRHLALHIAESIPSLFAHSYSVTLKCRLRRAASFTHHRSQAHPQAPNRSSAPFLHYDLNDSYANTEQRRMVLAVPMKRIVGVGTTITRTPWPNWVLNSTNVQCALNNTFRVQPAKQRKEEFEYDGPLLLRCIHGLPVK